MLLFSVSCNSMAKSDKDVFVVAQDNSGDYTTLGEAFRALPDDSETWMTIQVKQGIYEEKLILDVHKNKIRIVGEDPENTVITWNDHTGKIADGDTIHTYTSYTLSVRSNDVIFENITIQNSAGTVGQAVACETQGDKIV
jgi:pectinesterase